MGSMQRYFSGSLLSIVSQKKAEFCVYLHLNKPSRQCGRKEFKPSSNKTHLSAAFPIDVDGRRRHHGRVFHLPGMRTVLKNPAIFPDA